MDHRNLIRILIADDHQVVREGLAAILNPRVGIQVVAQARDGREAVALFHEHRPDITLMDLRMPRMDGLAAIQAIRADDPEARIIVLTALKGEEENSLRAGAVGVVLKDAPREELLSAIRTHSEEALSTRLETDVAVSLIVADITTQPDSDTIYDALASMGEAMIVADINGKVLFLNPMAERLTGWSLVEARGQDIATIYNAIEEESGQSVKRLLLDIARGGDVLAVRVDMLMVSKAGSQVPIQDNAAAVKNPVGETTGVVVLFHDASEQHETNRRLKAFNERLQRAITETNHRVKNNLQVLAALVEVYQEGEEGGLSRSAAQTLSLHVHTLAHIHDFLHRLTPVEETNANFDSVSVNATLTKLIPMVQATITGRLLSFSGEEIRLPAKQSAALALIVNELINNALKHGRGDVAVALGREDGTVTLEVLDNGPGFPNGFDRHKDLHTGLKVIESLIRTDLSGELHCANRPQGGARITVRFPDESEPTL